MTDGQIRYQTVLENQRHNLVMERLGGIEAEAKKMQAAASVISAQASTVAAEAAKSQANTASKRQKTDLAFNIISYLLPDANTVLRSGAQVISSLFG